MENVAKALAWSYIGDSRLFLIVTAVKVETECLHKKMTPFSGVELFRCPVGPQTYYIGKLGAYPVVHVQCGDKGALARSAAINTITEAIREWQPDAVIMPGIAFGLKRKEQRLGDVLISEVLRNFEIGKINEEGVCHSNAAIPAAGMTLRNRLQHCVRPLDANGQPLNVHFGEFLSGEKVINNKEYRDALAKMYPDAIGGDMESYGVYSAASSLNVNEWIIVKGICDWGYFKSKRKSQRQRNAAEAAVLFCEAALSPHNFDDLPRNPGRDEAIARDGGRPNASIIKFSLNLILLALWELNDMLNNEARLLRDVESALTPEQFLSLRAKALTIVSQCNRPANQGKLTEEDIHAALKGLNTPGNRIPCQTLETLYREPIRHRNFVIRMGLWLYQFLQENRGYTRKDREDIIRALQNYGKSYRELLFARLFHILSALDGEDKSFLFAGIQEMASFRDILDARRPHPAPGETDAVLTAARRSFCNAECNLSAFGFSVKEIALPQTTETKPDSMRAWERMEYIFRLQDLRNSYQNRALDEVLRYMQQPSEEGRKRAANFCETSARNMLALQPCRDNLDEEERANFLERGIDPADYYVPFRSFRDCTESDAQGLLTLKAQLFVPDSPDTLRILYNTTCQCANRDRVIDGLALNQFALESRLTDAEKTFFRKMLESLPTFPHIAWEEDLSVLNAKIEAAFREYERIVSSLAENTGEAFRDLAQFRKNQLERMVLDGVPREKALEFLEQLDEANELSSSMERLNQQELFRKNGADAVS